MLLYLYKKGEEKRNTLETYSPEIQTFLREIEKSFLQVLNNCVPADQLPVTQPIVVPAYENIGWDEQGEVISMTVVRRNLTWLKSIVENYSKEFLEKFAIFCDDWHIWDLHEDNIGFLRTPEVELPIILDWMSD